MKIYKKISKLLIFHRNCYGEKKREREKERERGESEREKEDEK